MPGRIWTVGHSNRGMDAFAELLEEHGIEMLVDVRRFPGSRRHPQFNREPLARSLEERGIGYRHVEDLGGRRKRAGKDSPNTAWRVEQFNAYADHMQSPEFQLALADLIREADERRTAVMCAEALPWQCHRRLIADALVVRGFKVTDIIGPGSVREHKLTDFARVSGERVTYPGEPLFESDQEAAD